MKFARTLPLVALLGALFLVAPAGAQTAEGVSIESIRLDDFPAVQLLVTAPGAAAVSPEDWVVLEGDAQADVRQVWQILGDRIEVVLVIDTSGSMEGPALDAAVQAAGSFLDGVPAGSRVSVIEFGGSATVVSPFTDDLDSVREDLGRLDASGETAMFDGIALAAQSFEVVDSVRTIVLLTDGADTASSTTQAEATQAVLGASGEFYSVRFDTADSVGETLDALASAVGGASLSATADELSILYTSLAERVSSQYVVEYLAQGEAGPQTISIALSSTPAIRSEVATRYPVVSGPQPSVVTTTEASTSTLAPPSTLAGAYPEVPWTGSREVLWYGIAGVFVGIAILLLYFLKPGAERRTAVRPTFRSSQQQMVSSVSRRLVTAAESAVRRRGGIGLDAQLEAAGLALRSGEFVILVALGALVALVIGTVGVGSLAMGILFAVIAAIGGPALLNYLARRRRSRFEDHLPDVLEMLASTIRTGYAPLQATELVSREVAEPTKTELGRVIAEARLGRDYIDAMAAAAKRTQSRDLQWVVEAMEVNRDVGGDISELLDTVAGTIRDRVRLKRMINALSAEGRLSAWVLVALPILLALYINATNPEYLEPLYTTVLGIAMIIGATISLLIGLIVIRRIINLEP